MGDVGCLMEEVRKGEGGEKGVIERRIAVDNKG